MKPEAQRLDAVEGLPASQEDSPTASVGAFVVKSAHAGMDAVPAFCAARCGGQGCRLLSWPELDGVCRRIAPARVAPPIVRRQGGIGIALIGEDARAHGTLKQVVEGSDEFVLRALFATAREAIGAIPSADVQIVVTEMALPDLCGIRCAHRLVGARPDIVVVIASAVRDPLLIRKAFAVGARHYLIKPFTRKQCLADLRLAACALNAVRIPPGPESPSAVKSSESHRVPRLGPREAEIMRCLAEGLLHKHIYDRCHMSYSLFRKLLRRTYRKLGTNKCTEALSRWYDLKEQHLGLAYGHVDQVAVSVQTLVAPAPPRAGDELARK